MHDIKTDDDNSLLVSCFNIQYYQYPIEYTHTSICLLLFGFYWKMYINGVGLSGCTDLWLCFFDYWGSLFLNAITVFSNLNNIFFCIVVYPFQYKSCHSFTEFQAINIEFHFIRKNDRVWLITTQANKNMAISITKRIKSHTEL